MKQRGVFERKLGEWWIRYTDAQGRYRREKAGTWAAARDLYVKRKNEALVGRKLPEKLRRAPVLFDEIARDALEYSRLHKRSYHDDRYRMERLLEWFRGRAAESLNAKEIEQCLATPKWKPATANRHRSLLSLTYKLAVRNGKVRENPIQQVARRKENNLRVRFLDADEESALRAKILNLCPWREPEFDLALHTGLRRNEQYRLRWDSVDISRGILTVADAKNGERRYVPLNSAACAALKILASRRNGSEYVCPGSDGTRTRDWQRWFEEAVRLAGIRGFRWHDLRHTFASRLAMAGVPLRTIAELLGHKTLSMTLRYAHLAPAHLQEAVERLVFPNRTDTTVAPLPKNGAVVIN
jgi:integrase